MFQLHGHSPGCVERELSRADRYGTTLQRMHTRVRQIGLIAGVGLGSFDHTPYGCMTVWMRACPWRTLLACLPARKQGISC